jgi:hypothetical protein
MTDDTDTDDAAARAAQFYEDGRLPVMNWPLRRPAEPPGPPKTKATPYILKKGLYGQMPPRLSTVDQLIDYEIAVICASCDHSEPVDLPKFMANGGRKSFQHLVTDLTCEACGGQLKSIEIYRTKDIPQADYPRLIYENPMCGRYTFTKSVDEIRSLFGFANTPNLAPRYNIPQYHGPLRAYKVSPALNNAKDNDHPGLIEPMEVQA